MKFLSKYSTWCIGLLALSGIQCAGGSSSSTAAPGPCSSDRPGAPCFVTRIMCIGDSNTSGVLGEASFRYPLWFEMRNAGALIDFVGTRFMVTAEDGTTSPNLSEYPAYYGEFDRDHEGYNGLRTDQVLSRIGPLVATQMPDVCLVMLGTNDVGQRGSSAITGALANLQVMVDTVRAQAPATMFLITTIPPIGDGHWYFQNEAHVATFNTALADSVPQWSTPGSPTILVDVNAALNVDTDMLVDGLHLNKSGQIKTARAIATAMEGALDGGYLPPSQAAASLFEPSFETLGLMDGEHSSLPLLDWRYPSIGNMVVGTFNPGAASYPGADFGQSPAGAEGDEVLSMENTGGSPEMAWVHQTLATTLEPGMTYELQVAVGQRLPTSPRGGSAYGGYELQLLAGNRIIASSSNRVTPMPGSFASDQLVVATDDLEDPAMGSPISIRMRMTWSDPGAATDFDWVRLSVY